jgi:hypothetical protein
MKTKIDELIRDSFENSDVHEYKVYDFLADFIEEILLPEILEIKNKEKESNGRFNACTEITETLQKLIKITRQ